MSRILSWANEYDKWNITIFDTIGDGNCLFHAIARAYFKPYTTGLLFDKPITKQQIVTSLRTELAAKLGEPIDKQSRLTPYDLLAGGNLCNISKAIGEYTLQQMMTELASNHPIGYGYLEFVANELQKDLYILDDAHKSLYVTDEPLVKGRNSIVLYYTEGHYELTGLPNKAGGYDTHFDTDHAFINFLKARMILKS